MPLFNEGSITKEDFLEFIKEEGFLFAIEETCPDIIEDKQFALCLFEAQMALSILREVIGYEEDAKKEN